MKDFIPGFFVVAFLIILAGGIVYGYRLFSNAATPVVIVEPEPGVKCATMVTGDGAAIDCWQEVK